ncbi:three-helix bundle dimerization domain-containing protein [Nocardia nova]|uniref:three-helix bundle dimerization domain-containing protein n=1 Tax=Nocardia nova TaxID=37330 RepID=UPI00192C3D89|nr:hypothetical protein [Nocardia nova]
MSDAIDREEKALRQLTSRLVDYYGGSHSPELVRDLVGQVRRRFDGHTVRDFVPILVERIVHREIQHLPAHDDAHAPDHTATQSFAAPVELPTAATDSAPADDKSVRPAADSEPGDSAADANSTHDADEPPAVNTVEEPAPTAEPGPPESSDATARFDAEPGAPVPTAPTPAPAGPTAAADTSSTPDESTTAPTGSAATPATSALSAASPDIALRLDDTDSAATGVVSAGGAGTVAQQDISSRAGSGPRTGRSASDGSAAGWRSRPRLIAAAAAVVVVVVALVAVFGFGGDDKPVAPAATAMVTAHGVVGSEKMGFFTDPRVVDVFARNGIQLKVNPAGSRQIATSVDLSGDDFAFPSSTLAAERIQRQRGVTAKYTPFSSPMAIASFGPIVDALTRAGVVHPGATPTFDMHHYLDLAQQGAQWDQLEGNTGYPVRKSVLLSTTDPRTSNSAAMYLAAAAYVANDDSIVQGAAAENFVLSKVSRLFTKQGYTDNSSEGPFAEYLTAGMGPTPMVWGYESQYVEAAVAGKLPANSVLLYPSPTVLSRHTLVPLNATGDRIGQLLTTDPDLQRLAAEHGFRTADPAQFAKVTAEHHIPVTPNVVDVVDTPTYDTLEHLLDGVARSYN